MSASILETKGISTDEILNSRNIITLFSKCILNNDDFDMEGLTCNFSVGEGVSSRGVFSSERLNENREVIASYIEQLCEIEDAPSVTKLYFDKNGKRWTDEAMVVEMLIQMGTASNMISLLLPPEIWHLLPGGVPYVGKNCYSIDKGISGIKGNEYVKLFGSNR